MPPPPLPTPPGKVWIQVGKGSETMHGFWIAFLNWFGHEPVVVAPNAVERSSQPTDPADPPPMSLFLSLHNGTIASLSVVVWSLPRNGQGPVPGTTFPVLSQLDTSNGTVIGKRPQVDPAAHSVVTVPVTAVACVVAVKVDMPIARAKYVSN